MKDILEHINGLKKQLAQLQPLSIENQQRLDKKFRMEWNFNSNHIEGNTLTYGETELLLIFDQTKGNHELREYEEMKGHDVALKLIYDLAEDKERQLTEKFIREINEILLVRPFYKEAITPDGQQTRREIKIGAYKSLPNSVLLQNGEIFHYPSPAETPAMMNDLMNWYSEAALNKNLQPVEVAAELHYKFVCIHPFDDGNGRIARLLMNYHLLKNDCPPVIIKTADKKNYLFALREADTGNIEAFKSYIAEQLTWSYEIAVKAGKGENVDEAGDWEKKIQILEKKFTPENSLKEKRTFETVNNVLKNSSLPLIHFLLNHLSKVNSLFFGHGISLKVDGGVFTSREKEFNSFTSAIERIILGKKNMPVKTLEIDYFLEEFKHNGLNTFNLLYTITFEFKKLSYSIHIKHKRSFKPIEKPYHEFINNSDVENFANILSDIIIEDIELKQKTQA